MPFFCSRPPFALFLSLVLSLSTLLLSTLLHGEEKAASNSSDAVSYYEQIHPIFQAKCHGCHQPAKADGDYVMTAFGKMVAGGESEE